MVNQEMLWEIGGGNVMKEVKENNNNYNNEMVKELWVNKISH